MSSWQSCRRYSELEKKICGVLRYQESMALHTSFRVGGPAEIFIIPSCTDEVQEIVYFASHHGLPIQIMGMGSNLLVSDEGLRGIVLKIASPLDGVAFEDHQVTAEAGLKCIRLIAQCFRHKLHGLDFLSGIPGTLGGAVAMNAGAFGHAISDRLHSALVYDQEALDWQIFYSKDFQFSYRDSLIQKSNRYVLLQITLDLVPGMEKDEITRIREKLIKRKLTQPLQYPNAGCIWKNPPGNSAGKIIEELGLKGYCYGHARISELHGNFIIHDGSSNAGEIFALIKLVEEHVYQGTGIQLEREIKILGNFGFKF